MKNGLVYLINQASGQTWELNSKQKNMIGRGVPKNNKTDLILLPHPTVSKLHAQLWLDSETQQWYFENISRNGSSINGSDIPGKQVIHDGDKIKIGPFDLLFCENFLDAEGTVEVKKPDALSSQKWSNSPTKIEIITICILFGFAFVLILVWMWKMFTW